MECTGRVRNGVVVLDRAGALPEGAAVTVIFGPKTRHHHSADSQRVDFPLVRSSNPGSVRLTNKDIGQALDEEDVSS